MAGVHWAKHKIPVTVSVCWCPPVNMFLTSYCMGQRPDVDCAYRFITLSVTAAPYPKLLWFVSTDVTAFLIVVLPVCKVVALQCFTESFLALLTPQSCLLQRFLFMLCKTLMFLYRFYLGIASIKKHSCVWKTNGRPAISLSPLYTTNIIQRRKYWHNSPPVMP